MLNLDSKIKDRLEQRREKDSFRSLAENPSQYADFCSNDYLGFARNQTLQRRIQQRIEEEMPTLGATGSRLISGNSAFCEQLELKIAQFHHAEAGLIFNSGYDANIGVFACLTDRTDTIVYDELVHASIRDGIRLSKSKSFSFKHNDLEDLKKKLSHAQGNILIAVESIYSMDGDQAPLIEILELAKEHNAALIVDEAHSTGLIGEQGKGLVVELGLEKEVFARIHTFGKALGIHGAIVLSSLTLRNYLINFARSFIYTTALPMHNLIAIEEAYQLLEETKPIELLTSNINYFNAALKSPVLDRFIPSNSAIKCLVIPGNKAAKALAKELESVGVLVKAILSPTVAETQERLRICLHSFNTVAEINTLTEILNQRC